MFLIFLTYIRWDKNRTKDTEFFGILCPPLAMLVLINAKVCIEVTLDSFVLGTL